MLALLAALALAAELEPSGCAGDRLVVAPFEPLALGPAEARAAESEVREKLARMSGLCLEPRAQTVQKLLHRDGQLPQPCADRACSIAQAVQLEARWLLTGTVVGVGGRRSLSLTLAPGVDDPVRRATVTLSGKDDAALRVVLEGLFHPETLPSSAVAAEPGAAPVRSRARWPGFAVGGAGIASAAAGLLMGAVSQQTAQGISQGRTGCPGGGTGYAECFDGKVRQGREQALAANLLLGAGAVLGAGAGVMIVFELP
ncbi:MAG: hypothetical protein ACYC8T_39480 [Myxococcaceae bacterium]